MRNLCLFSLTESRSFAGHTCLILWSRVDTMQLPTDGTLSVRVPSQIKMFITPTPWRKSSKSRSSICRVSPERTKCMWTKVSTPKKLWKPSLGGSRQVLSSWNACSMRTNTSNVECCMCCSMCWSSSGFYSMYIPPILIYYIPFCTTWLSVSWRSLYMSRYGYQKLDHPRPVWVVPNLQRTW